jgi:sulfonate transport system permease protein
MSSDILLAEPLHSRGNRQQTALRSFRNVAAANKPAILVIALLLAWYVASWHPLLSGIGPSDIARTFVSLAEGPLWPALASTIVRFLKGFALGCVIGIPIGLAMAAHPVTERLFGSIVHPLRQVPLFGWIPLIGLTFGLGETSKIVFVALAVAYVMVLAAFEAGRSTPSSLREVADVFALSRLHRWRHLFVPSMLPSLLSGVRVAVAIGWSAVFGAEILLTAGPGLGTLVWGARELGKDDVVIVGTLVIILTGVLTNGALAAYEKRAFVWRKASDK